ncbi:MAG TPA: carboxypeptidase-like regulatory domain-containing protein [Candidatus Xenobia bacterium]|nr:carboxypeptidase-like regulatory domain-containing protein [Candidatus Xenobia bacterium]
MKRGGIATAAALLALLVAAGPVPAGGDDELRLEVVVTAEETGKPVPGASVYVKYTEERFMRKDKKEELTGKTNEEGRALVPGVRAGKVLVQVVAKGWKTFGQNYEVTGPKHTIEIKLKPAKRWY